MDPKVVVIFVCLFALSVNVALAAGVVLGAWVYRCGVLKSSPMPQFRGRRPADPAEEAKPYHRKPPKP